MASRRSWDRFETGPAAGGARNHGLRDIAGAFPARVLTGDNRHISALRRRPTQHGALLGVLFPSAAKNDEHPARGVPPHVRQARSQGGRRVRKVHDDLKRLAGPHGLHSTLDRSE